MIPDVELADAHRELHRIMLVQAWGAREEVERKCEKEEQSRLNPFMGPRDLWRSGRRLSFKRRRLKENR